MITPPTANEDCRTLWRKVAECATVINALSNMKVIVEGQLVNMIGDLKVGDGDSVVKVTDNKEVAN